MIQYRWQIQGGAKTTAWTNYKMNTPAFSYTSGVLNQICNGSGITPPNGAGISDILEVRIIRDNANATGIFAGANVYNATARVTSVDIHVEKDTIGSNDEYTK